MHRIHQRSRLLSLGGLILLLLSSVPTSAVPTSPPNAQPSAWEEDLRFLGHELAARHKNLFFKLSEARYQQALNALIENADRLSPAQAAVAIMRLLAQVGDAHTSLNPNWRVMRFAPLKFRHFSDGYFVVAAPSHLQEFIGASLQAIGGVPIQQLTKALSALIAHDNSATLHVHLPRFLVWAGALEAVGAAEAQASVAFTLVKDGKRVTKHIPPQLAGRLNPQSWTQPTRSLALYEQKSQLDFWNDYLPESKTLYFKYNRCRDHQGFAALVRGTMGFIAQRPVDRFVLDLRDNGGGDSSVFRPLLVALTQHQRLNRKGALYVILGRHTFSSALLNALDMRRTDAIFVGEATSGKPNHYGELDMISLPRSGWKVSVSTKYFQALPDSDPNALVPEQVITTTHAQWLAGHDPVMETIVKRPLPR